MESQRSPVKQVEFQIQEMEKKRLASEQNAIEESEPLMKDYVQYLKNKTEQCKLYLEELTKSRLTPIKLKKNIEEFIRTL